MALMQLIAETYEVMQKGLGLSGEQMHAAFNKWNAGRLQSFLIEITRDIFAFREPGVDHLLLEDIKRRSALKGTGKVDLAGGYGPAASHPHHRHRGGDAHFPNTRPCALAASSIYKDPKRNEAHIQKALTALEEALYFSTVIAYAQGVHLLSQASKEFGYALQMEKIALIWRGGCIIRSTFLEDIYQAYKKNTALEHLLLDAGIAKK